MSDIKEPHKWQQLVILDIPNLDSNSVHFQTDNSGLWLGNQPFWSSELQGFGIPVRMLLYCLLLWLFYKALSFVLVSKVVLLLDEQIRELLEHILGLGFENC